MCIFGPTFNLLFMKKMILLFGLGTVLFLSSCNKDYSCYCVAVDGVTGDVIEETTTINGKKKDVVSSCDSGDYYDSVNDITVECEILE